MTPRLSRQVKPGWVELPLELPGCKVGHGMPVGALKLDSALAFADRSPTI
jgi:hypothetical protein